MDKETFQRTMAQHILDSHVSSVEVWKLACSLMINVILQVYDADALANVRLEMQWDLSVIDQLIRSANPRITVETVATMSGPLLAPTDEPT